MCVRVESQQKPRECPAVGRRIPLQPSRKGTIVEERDQFGILSVFHSLIGCGPVEMASAWVIPLSDHSHVEVEFPNALYLQEDLGICFLFVCVSFPCMPRWTPRGLRL